MEGGYASVTRRQLQSSELLSVLLRLAVLTALSILYLTTARAPRIEDAENLVIATTVVVALAYSVLSLELVAHSAFRSSLAFLSAILDALVASAFLWVGFWGALAPHLLLIAAAGIALAMFVTASVMRPAPWSVVAGATASAVASAGIVLPLLWGPQSSLAGEWVFLPAGFLALGLAATLASLAIARMFARDLATDDLKRASRRLRMTMEIVQVSVTNLGQLVSNLERVSATLSEGARNQARSIDRIGGAVTALNTSQERIFRSTEVSAKTIRRTVDSTDAGNQVVNHVIEDVVSISATVERMVSSLELINDLADNTNLLALNANIEASRGGSESMGFAVVADEIRKLAEQSQEAAIEAGRLVKQVSKVVATTDGWSRNAGEVFGRINGDLTGHAEYVSKLQLSLQEQLKANREVERSISRINEVTVQNTESADRVRESVGELEKEVAKLKALVDGRITETARLS